LKRSVAVLPAEDRRSEDPKKNGGLRSMVFIFRVESERGRTEFELNTNWYPDDIHQSFIEKGMFTFLRPFPRQVQQYERGSDVPLVSDGAALESADRMFSLAMIGGGDDYIWSPLEELHRARFGDEPDAEDVTVTLAAAGYRPMGRFEPPAPAPPDRRATRRDILLAAAEIIMENHVNG
jgi:hypothetical protein